MIPQILSSSLPDPITLRMFPVAEYLHSPSRQTLASSLPGPITLRMFPVAEYLHSPSRQTLASSLPGPITLRMFPVAEYLHSPSRQTLASSLPGPYMKDATLPLTTSPPLYIIRPVLLSIPIIIPDFTQSRQTLASSLPGPNMKDATLPLTTTLHNSPGTLEYTHNYTRLHTIQTDPSQFLTWS